MDDLVGASLGDNTKSLALNDTVVPIGYQLVAIYTISSLKG